MAQYLSPVDYAVELFGGVRALARAINRTPQCVSEWRSPLNPNRGQIPVKAIVIILNAAKEKGIEITAEDLVFGRECR